MMNVYIVAGKSVMPCSKETLEKMFPRSLRVAAGCFGVMLFSKNEIVRTIAGDVACMAVGYWIGKTVCECKISD